MEDSIDLLDTVKGVRILSDEIYEAILGSFRNEDEDNEQRFSKICCN